jgi:predicted nucleic acid-binding protein
MPRNGLMECARSGNVTNLSEIVAPDSVLFVDTAPVIYFVERKEPYFAWLEPLFNRIDQGGLTAVTSAITLAECLYYPYKNNNQELVDAFTRRLVTGHHVRFTSATAVIAAQSAQLRARYSLGFADAFQVATAVVMGCNTFLTNDRQLKRIQSESLKVVVISDFAP